MRKLAIVLIPLLVFALCFSGCAGGDVDAGKIATTERLFVSVSLGFKLVAELEPTSSATPDTNYVVDLYEKGQLRASNWVNWNGNELDVRKSKQVLFRISEREYWDYLAKDIRHIFSIDVHE